MHTKLGHNKTLNTKTIVRGVASQRELALGSRIREEMMAFSFLQAQPKLPSSKENPNEKEGRKREERKRREERGRRLIKPNPNPNF
jgi:hypothetical protein